MNGLTLPPLSLYIHIPWCVQKCPYCDFNSHAVKQGIPEQEYIAHLLADLQLDLPLAHHRPLQSIFIGGGTPSTFSAAGIASIFAGVEALIPFADDIEITMEANPGTVDEARFAGYVAAGVNRFSIGVQSFQATQLKALGRIHDPAQAVSAAQLAQQLMQLATNGTNASTTNANSNASNKGLQSFNLDLMHGLPEQSVEEALDDLRQAIALKPPHLSWYQLTIEPNTAFASKPPELPADDTLWDIQEQGHQLLLAAGYQQYETSAYALPGFQCRHNLNYWRFGDYLGIGCGAHGKITQLHPTQAIDAPAGQQPDCPQIIRTVKIKHPKGYMDISRGYLDSSHAVDAADLPFEFFMNRFRLLEPCPTADFSRYTGLNPDTVHAALQQAVALGLIDSNTQQWQITGKGVRYLNELLQLFL